MSQFKDFPGWVGVGGMKLGIQLSSAGTELGKNSVDGFVNDDIVAGATLGNLVSVIAGDGKVL